MSAKRVAERIKTLSGGRLEIAVAAAGEIVPAFEVRFCRLTSVMLPVLALSPAFAGSRMGWRVCKLTKTMRRSGGARFLGAIDTPH